MSAKSQFTETKGPEQLKGFGFNVGGAMVKEKSNFSLAVNGQNQYTTPNLSVALPNQTRFDVLDARQPFDNVNINALVDYALTRDQTLRVRVFAEQQQAIQPRHRRLRSSGARLRAGQQPLHVSRARGRTDRPPDVHQYAVDDVVDGLRIAVRYGGADDRRAGRVHAAAARSRPAACTARTCTFASDVDYIRGIHSWRGGVQVYADWYRANLNNNYLGTYTFADNDAFLRGHAAALHAQHRRSVAQLLPRADWRVLPGRLSVPRRV